MKETILLGKNRNMGVLVLVQRRKWQPTPVFLPGESQGCGSLVGCRLWGCTESDTTEATQQQQQQQYWFSLAKDWSTIPLFCASNASISSHFIVLDAFSNNEQVDGISKVVISSPLVAEIISIIYCFNWVNKAVYKCSIKSLKMLKALFLKMEIT